MQYGKAVLVTGGSGFIGKHLVCRLLKKGHRVRIIDNAPKEKDRRIECINASVLDSAALNYAVKGVDLIYHLAGIRFSDDPANFHNINATGTVRVAEAARKHCIEKIINVSDVVAKSPKLNPAPPDHYHASKLWSERYLSLCNRKYGVNAISLRMSEIFGPGQFNVYHYIIPHLVKLMMNYQDATLVVKPGYTRDFCYVDNAVDALMLAGELSVKSGVVNIANGKSHDIKAVSQAIKLCLTGAFEPKIVVKKTDAPWVYSGNVSIDEALAELKYIPQVSFEKGLRQYISSLQVPSEVGAGI